MQYLRDLLDHPMGPYIILTYVVGALIIGLVIWFHLCEAEKSAVSQAALQAAIANAKPVRGKISRFGTASADEYSVDYTFTPEGDPTVYQTSSGYLSKASHGALTKPGDVVTFNVLPGYGYVRDFYNAATATGAGR